MVIIGQRWLIELVAIGGYTWLELVVIICGEELGRIGGYNWLGLVVRIG